MSVFFIFLFIGYLLSNNYRDFIYESQLTDFGLADAGANILVVVIMCTMLWTLNIKISANKVMDVIKVTEFYLTIETASYFVPALGTFDFYDLMAYPIGAFMTIGILRIFDRNEILQFRRSF